MKKIMVGVLFLAVAPSGVFAERHIVYGGGGLGLGFPFIMSLEAFASYEFMATPQFSFGASFACQVYPMALFPLIFINAVGGEVNGLRVNHVLAYVAEGQMHWYPWAKTFHADLGVGYSNYLSSMQALFIAPGIGWMFDEGEPGGFVLNLGFRTEIFVPLNGFVMRSEDGRNVLVPVNLLTMRIGLGYRF